MLWRSCEDGAACELEAGDKTPIFRAMVLESGGELVRAFSGEQFPTARLREMIGLIKTGDYTAAYDVWWIHVIPLLARTWAVEHGSNEPFGVAEEDLNPERLGF